jgi:hypothetical protein
MAYRDPARQREAEHRWYRANRERVYAKKNRKRERLRARIKAAKEVPCTDCGVCYPFYVMDFDHVDGEKVMDVSKVVNFGSVTKLERELTKCEVVCANCHRERTWRRLDATAPKVPGQPPRAEQLSLLDGEFDRAPRAH